MAACPKEGANRTKVEAGGNTCATSLASRCGVCFHGSKSFVEKAFAGNYNSSLASVHEFIILGAFAPTLLPQELHLRGEKNAGQAETLHLNSLCTY
jgi:hypothetical protein